MRALPTLRNLMVVGTLVRRRDQNDLFHARQSSHVKRRSYRELRCTRPRWFVRLLQAAGRCGTGSSAPYSVSRLGVSATPICSIAFPGGSASAKAAHFAVSVPNFFKAIAIALLMLSPDAAVAATVQYPVSIPSECVELAQREGQPVVIEGKAQALRAKYKLYRLSSSDPLVRQCRDAVQRLQAQLKHQ